MAKNIGFVDVDWLEAGLGSVCDSIRAKTGDTGSLAFPDAMKAAVDSIEVLSGGGGEDISDTSFVVRVIDYDGAILKEESLEFGGVFTLPDPSRHDRLVFDGWSSPVDITNNTVTVADRDIVIGAMYYTASGALELDITLNSATGKVLHLSKILNSDGAAMSVDWGDGTSGTIQNATASSHTYADYGDYTVKITGVVRLNSSSGSRKLVDDSSVSGLAYALQAVYFPKTLTRIDNATPFNNNAALKYVAWHSSIQTLASGMLNYCYSLRALVIPTGVTTITERIMSSTSVKWLVLPNSLTSLAGAIFDAPFAEYMSIPDSISPSGMASIQSCYNLKRVKLPNNMTTIPESCLSNAGSLKKVTLPLGVTSIGDNAFTSCWSLEQVDLPNGITSIGKNAFNGCYSLKSVTFPEALTTIGINAFKDCRVAKFTDIPDTVTSIGDYAFQGCYGIDKLVIPAGVETVSYLAYGNNIREVVFKGTPTALSGSAFANNYIRLVDLSACTSVPTLSATAFNTIGKACVKVLVPASLLEDFKAATNWSVVANIVGV